MTGLKPPQHAATGSVNSSAWLADFQSAVKSATIGGKVDIAKLDAATRPLFNRLDGIDDVGARGNLVTSALWSLGQKEAVELLAARRGQPVREIDRNLFTALNQLAAAPLSGDEAVKKIKLETLLDTGASSVSLFRGDVRDIPGAHATIIPAHTTLDSAKGGGGRGGVEQAWLNRAEEVGSESMQSAVREFEKQRGTQQLEPGTTLSVSTGVGPALGPSVMQFVASVPPVELRHRALNANNPAMAELRKSHLSLVMKAALDEAVASAKRELAHEPTAEDPIVITMPIMCTGPQGSLTVAEAGAMMSDFLRSWCTNNPGVKLIIARAEVYGEAGVTAEKDTASFIAGIKTGKSTAKPTMLSTNGVFEAVLEGQGKPASTNAVALNAGYVREKLDNVSAQLNDTFGKAKLALNDQFALVSRFSHRTTQEAAYQIAKTLALPDLAKKLGIEGAFSPATVKQLLANDAIRDRVAARVLTHPELKNVVDKDNAGKKLFGGDAKMSEIVAAALAVTLREMRYEHLDGIYQEFKDDLISSQSAVKAAQAALAAKNAEVAKLTRALQQATSEKTDSSATVTKLTQQNADLAKEIRDLHRSLRDRADVERRVKERTSSASASYVTSYSSEGGSGGGGIG